MEIFIEDDYEAMSIKAFNDLIRLARLRSNPLICTASGASPAGLYKQLVNHIKVTGYDVSGWYFVGLDEWTGMNSHDEGSCRWHLNRELFYPLRVADNHICFFDGRATDPVEECDITERFIAEQGGIDVAVLGLGLNGHVGMNEPGVLPGLRSHVAEIHALTQQTGQKYFSTPKDLSGGISLGIANLLEVKNLLLLVSGSNKAAIVKQVLEDKISALVPAGLLRKHPGLKVYLDRDAASALQNDVYA
jgi:6-phosphogluconolactonase/glucosamine-6-phosphate isomerase/deaminase